MSRSTLIGNDDTLNPGPLYLTMTTADATYQMKRGDHVVSAISSAADGVAIITLPSLAEACGEFYYIVAPTGAAGGDISLYEKETGAELTTYGDLDTDGDNVLLFAGTTAWVPAYDGVA